MSTHLGTARHRSLPRQSLPVGRLRAARRLTLCAPCSLSIASIAAIPHGATAGVCKIAPLVKSPIGGRVSVMTKIVGMIPARMKASRFPGKPLFPILGRPMVEHVWHRAALFDRWDELAICTCDAEIMEYAKAKNFPVIMTADTHIRALDRVAEAATKCTTKLGSNDVVVCVQGDEPMLRPNMIAAVCDPFFEDETVQGTILAVHILDEEVFVNPDTVKLVHDTNRDVLYTSRAPIPYGKKFSPELNALRIGGIFAFRWHFL